MNKKIKSASANWGGWRTIQFSVAALILLFLASPVLAQEEANEPAVDRASEAEAPVEETAAEPAVIAPAPEAVVVEPATVVAEPEVTPEDLGVKEPTLLPDSPFYFLKEWGRKIQETLTTDEAKKAELLQKFANQRLIEAQKLLIKNPQAIEKVQKVLSKSDMDLEKLKERLSALTEKKDARADKIIEKFTDNAVKQDRLLDGLMLKLKGLEVGRTNPGAPS